MKNKIKYIIFLILCFCIFNVDFIDAKTIEVLDCEYTDAYKKWLKLSQSEKNKVLEPTKCKTNDIFFSKVGSKVNETYASSRFDLRDYGYVTSVKDQEDSGTCWTFATMASIESNLLMNGIGNYDLSEAHLAFSAQNISFEGLMPVNRTYDDGGNALISSAYLFNRMGPVLESDMPFSTLINIKKGTSSFPTNNSLSSINGVVSVKSSSFLSSDSGACSEDAITSIKKYLVNNGALYTSMYFDYSDKSLSINEDGKIISRNLNGEYYYYDGKTYFSYDDKIVEENQEINHAVTIIGWDDTISASNFSTKPSRDGAFIIKNSYGEKLEIYDEESTVVHNILMGDNGYYYVSYDDINICTALTGFYDVTQEANDNVYFYDKIGVDEAFSVNENVDIYLGNVFNTNTDGGEKLKSVAFFSGMVGQKYDILFSDDGDLSNSRIIKSGITDTIGYTTIDVENINIINSKFGIIIKFYYGDGPIYTYMNELSIGSFFKMEVDDGLSFMSLDGNDWYDFKVSYQNCIAPIRAYTDNFIEEDIVYSFSKNDSLVNDNKIIVSYDYSNVDANDIIYNIFSADDTDYLNVLTYNFNVTNNLVENKSIVIEINDNTVVGDYTLVAKVNDTAVVEKFSVYNDNGVLTFIEPKKDANDPEDDKVDMIVIDNPKNNDVPSKTDDEITNNSKTGDTLILITFVFGICAIVYCIYYFRYKRYNDNKM